MMFFTFDSIKKKQPFYQIGLFSKYLPKYLPKYPCALSGLLINGLCYLTRPAGAGYNLTPFQG
jgi:hypothetical protein